ncbi:hypothetical protein O9929_04485 [Vibrio lentus]|nr:hypothetical protein [Vibrio lentus]
MSNSLFAIYFLMRLKCKYAFQFLIDYNEDGCPCLYATKLDKVGANVCIDAELVKCIEPT